jgi:D-tyrosyl-tRNA(Tyr) deacylase
MRAVVQRVGSAAIFVGNRKISSIEKGALVFLGVERGDDNKDADYLLDKVINLRIFDDEKGKMNHSLLDKSYAMLVVSQFTLLGDCRKGRRPSFVSAEDPEKANLLYEYFISKGRERINNVSGGEFQAMMKVELINDGPVTILLDSRKSS